jgi:hypothetical protein
MHEDRSGYLLLTLFEKELIESSTLSLGIALGRLAGGEISAITKKTIYVIIIYLPEISKLL